VGTRSGTPSTLGDTPERSLLRPDPDTVRGWSGIGWTA
jgi:hypothetical protein